MIPLYTLKYPLTPLHTLLYPQIPLYTPIYPLYTLLPMQYDTLNKKRNRKTGENAAPAVFLFGRTLPDVDG